MNMKPGTMYANEDGDILTVRERDEADRIVIDVEGDFKTLNDEEEFREFVEKNGFEETDTQLDPEDMDDEEIIEPEDGEGMEDDEEDTDEEEDEEPEPDPTSKIDRFKELYNNMLELGATGNDKIDKAVQKLKKALSDELNTMTAEDVNFDELHTTLKEDGYIN